MPGYWIGLVVLLAAGHAFARWRGRVTLRRITKVGVPLALLGAVLLGRGEVAASVRLAWLAGGLVCAALIALGGAVWPERGQLRLGLSVAMLGLLAAAYVLLPPYGQMDRPLLVLGVVMAALLTPLAVRLWRAQAGAEHQRDRWLSLLNGAALSALVYFGVATAFIKHSGTVAANYAIMAGVLLLFAGLVTRGWRRFVSGGSGAAGWLIAAEQLGLTSLTLGALLYF